MSFHKKYLSIIVVVVALAVFIWAVVREQLLERPDSLSITTSGAVEMCLFCHGDITLDTAHDAKMIGCTPCHMGDPLQVEKEAAHTGMVVNPGDLRIADKSCGVSGCHPADVHNVKNSLMATNRGIIGTLMYYWGESESQNTDLTVEELIETGQNSFALDYFRKLCATCHLWKQRYDMPGAPLFFNEKGGGCTACHLLSPEEGDRERRQLLEADEDDIWYGFDENPRDPKKPHPQIVKKVSSVKCVRCHNRSARIGTSYLGVFEAEEEDAPPDIEIDENKRLPGGRFYLELADDIHNRAGMECIDCHLQEEIMGDGTSYAHYEDQLEISCEMCHGGDGVSRRGNKLTNFEEVDGKAQLVGKVNGKVWKINAPKQGVCDFEAHKRISCEACHSTLVPQCYGCHITLEEGETHLDKLSMKETKGQWQEDYSYIQNEEPMLGVWNDSVVIMTPGCQDMVTVEDEKGEVKASFNRFTMAAINPHTVQKKGRDCLECHASPKTVGLGEGRLYRKDGEMVFEAKYAGLKTEAGNTVPLDSYVNLAGQAQQLSARRGLRPFNAKELRAILRVGECVSCHKRYDDPIWKTYTHETKPCPYINEKEK